MIQDLHAHTWHSFCGRDDPHAIIRAAIEGGVELFGISDHSYGVAHQRDYSYHPERDEWLSDYQRSLDSYLTSLHLLRDLYADQITIKCGIEIPTANIPHILLPKEVDISGFDYCLLEHLDQDVTTEPDLFALADRCGCPAVGVAHTDLPLFLDRQGIDKLAFFTEMAKRNIFWEMNVSYDSIHNYQRLVSSRNRTAASDSDTTLISRSSAARVKLRSGYPSL